MSTTDEGTDARSRILAVALRLMAEQGSAGVSMRQLANACGLNVATIYHYFPSKADLLRSVIADRRYFERLAVDQPPLDPALAPRERLAGLVEWLWSNALEEESVWRLLVGESIRGEEAAVTTAAELVEALGAVLERWLEDGFPELRDAGSDRPAAVAMVLRSQVFSLVVERLALGEAATATGDRARALAAVVFP